MEIAFHCSGKQQKKPTSTKSGLKLLLSGHMHLKVERCFTNMIYFFKMVLSWNTHLWILLILGKIQSSCLKKLQQEMSQKGLEIWVFGPRTVNKAGSLMLFYGCCSLQINRPQVLSTTLSQIHKVTISPSTNPWHCKAPALPSTLQLTAVSTNELKQPVLRSWSYL